MDLDSGNSQVRVPTNMNGKCIFWEFATDSYDIGFGIYFEWAKPVTNEVTVHVSDSDEVDDASIVSIVPTIV